MPDSSATAATSTPPIAQPAARGLVPVLVLAGMVVSVVSTLGAPLIPTIADVDGVSLATAQWALTAALLSGAVATPVLGRLGDGPHRRLVVLVVLGVVLIGCVLAALPLGFAGLLTGRALQGVGLGIAPLTFAFARDHLPQDRVRPAVALLSVTAVTGIGLGYPLNGLLTEAYGLRAGFWVGAAITGIALAAAAAVLPVNARRDARRFDLLGAVLLSAAFSALLLAVGQGAVWGWTSLRLLGLGTAGLVLLGSWVWTAIRREHPLVDLRLLRNRVVLATDVTALLAGVGLYLLLALVTRFVQTAPSAGYGFDATVTMAGLVLLPFSIGSVLSSRLAASLSARISPEAVLQLGCVIFLGAMLSFLLARGSLWQVFVSMGLAGLGVGCTFAGMPALIVRAVQAHETGSATAFNQVLRIMGYTLGSALCATVLQAYTPDRRGVPEEAGYDTAALAGCAVWVCAALVSFLLLRTHRGDAVASPPMDPVAQQDVAVDVSGAPTFTVGPRSPLERASLTAGPGDDIVDRLGGRQR